MLLTFEANQDSELPIFARLLQMLGRVLVSPNSFYRRDDHLNERTMVPPKDPDPDFPLLSPEPMRFLRSTSMILASRTNGNLTIGSI